MNIDGNRFRAARLATFLMLVDQARVKDRPVRILDLGGTISYWRALKPLWRDRDLDFTLVNLGAEVSDDDVFHVRPGDACALDYPDNEFDIVHSNSVIEHVGHWPEMAAFAREVRRLAPRYYLQTPNFWFPFEPHYRTAFFHWLPQSLRAHLLVGKRRGFRKAPDYDAAMRDIQTVNLLTARQLRHLLPDAVIRRERLGPLTKSLIAVR